MKKGHQPIATATKQPSATPPIDSDLYWFSKKIDAAEAYFNIKKKDK